MCVADQAGLRLTSSPISKDTFSRDVAHRMVAISYRFKRFVIQNDKIKFLDHVSNAFEGLRKNKGPVLGILISDCLPHFILISDLWLLISFCLKI